MPRAPACFAGWDLALSTHPPSHSHPPSHAAPQSGAVAYGLKLDERLKVAPNAKLRCSLGRMYTKVGAPGLAWPGAY